MSGAGILLMIDGEAVDLSLLSWYEKAPCGCINGVHTAYSAFGDGPPLVVSSVEAVWEESYGTKRERDKYKALGFTWFPDLRSKCVELMSGDCPHDPKWGIPPRPQPVGHQWSAVRALGSRPTLMHLVPDLGVENARERRYGSGDTAALCGSKAFHWHVEWHDLSGKVECSRCVKKATDLVTAAPTTEATS